MFFKIPKTDYIFLFYCIVFVFLCSGCGIGIDLVLQRPAEINLVNYKKIAVTDFKNPQTSNNIYGNFTSSENYVLAGTELSDALVAKLFESQTYEIIDRSNLDKVLEEQKLNSSGLVDDKTAIELGGILGISALIVGSVTSAHYREEPVKVEERFEKYKDQIVSRRIYTRTGSLTYSANIKFIDVVTSKVLAVKTVSADQSATRLAINSTPDLINPQDLYNKAKEVAVNSIMRAIAPYKIQKFVWFETDREMKDLEIHTYMIRLGDIEKGLIGLEELSRKTYTKIKVKAKALYNYGIMLAYTGNPEKAVIILQEVNQMVPGKRLYMDALFEARKEVAIKSKMKEQHLM